MPIYTIKTPSGFQLDIQADDETEAMRGAEEWHAERTGLRGLARPITNLIPTQRQLARESLDQVARGVTQLSGQGEGGDTTWEGVKGLGNVALGSLGYVASPIGAGLRTFIGEPIEEATGGRVPKEYTEFAAGLAIPGLGLPRLPKSIAGAPRQATPGVPGFNVAQGAPTLPPTLPARPMGVTLSEGQRTRDLPQIQFETSAARGQLGPAAQRAAQAFVDQQQAELAAARSNIAETLDPVTGMQVAETPAEAAALAQRGLQERAQRARAGVTASYETARGLPGEIHAGAFEGMPQRIKGELTLGDSPTIIDPMLTPYANAMIKDLEANVGRIKIPNAADPFGAPNAERITGVALKGVEQWRKRLSKLRSDAFASGNNADANAARAVLDAFDNQIDNAVNGGLFTGDPRAVKAWNAARAAHSDYRATFTRQGARDRIGDVIEKIIGRGNVETIPNDVADFIYGAAGTNPKSINVAVVNRLRGILGETSPEWAAIKQGLFSRLAEAGEGMTQWGPGRVAQNLNKFLNNEGREMAAMLYSPAERSIMQQYADMLRHLEIPQAGANWSNTATFAGQGFRESTGVKIAAELTHWLTSFLGGGAAHLPIIGKPIRSGIEAAIEKVAGVPGQAQDARRVAAQMPVIANVVRQHARAQRAWSLSPSARNKVRLGVTTNNLAAALDKLGIQLPDFDGTAVPQE